MTPSIRATGRASPTRSLTTLASTQARLPDRARSRASLGRRAASATAAMAGTAATAPSCITASSGRPSASGSWLTSRNRLASKANTWPWWAARAPAATTRPPTSTRSTSPGCRRTCRRRAQPACGPAVPCSVPVDRPRGPSAAAGPAPAGFSPGRTVGGRGPALTAACPAPRPAVGAPQRCSPGGAAGAGLLRRWRSSLPPSPRRGLFLGRLLGGGVVGGSVLLSCHLSPGTGRA